MTSQLTAIPNVGPAVARKLERLEVTGVCGASGPRLAGGSSRGVCLLEGRRLDPCLLDTFVVAVDYADGGPARHWWEYSRERKERGACLTSR